jgi:hypothetical protein
LLKSSFEKPDEIINTALRSGLALTWVNFGSTLDASSALSLDHRQPHLGGRKFPRVVFSSAGRREKMLSFKGRDL